MSSNFAIREGGTRDLASLVELAEGAPLSGWGLAAISASLATPREVVLVAERGAEVLGFAVIQCVFDECSLLAIAVARAAQRLGVGRRLLYAAEERARAQGAIVMLLEVRSGNSAARMLYDSFGYEAVGTRRAYYADGEDAVLYLRRLT